MKSLFATLRNLGVSLSVVAPDAVQIPPPLTHVTQDERLYDEAIKNIQLFRGRVFVEDRLLPSTALDATGRHNVEADYKSWHLVLEGGQGEVCGTMRLKVFRIDREPINLERLQLYGFMSRMHPELRESVETGVYKFIADSAKSYSYFTEVGGWAVGEDQRKTVLGPVLAASLWGLARASGGGTGIATARIQNQASEILQRMGGMEIFAYGSALPPFYDSYHACEHQLLGFDSEYLSSRLEATVADIKTHILQTNIITP